VKQLAWLQTLFNDRGEKATVFMWKPDSAKSL
jgi:hypothetical protein